MVREDKASWKQAYFTKLKRMFETYDQLFIVGADNVSSKQFQEIRRTLRGKGEILMGKNTMIRKAIKDELLADNPSLERLLPLCQGNIGFVFVKGDLLEVRDIIKENRLRAPARAGAIAPRDVIIPPQNTGMGPEKTSFFQALQIATKITRGTIEITGEVTVVKAGNKVGPSESTLLNMLNVSPFTYGLEMLNVYQNGSVFSPDVLDITDDAIVKDFMEGVNTMASVCLAAGYPTAVSVPHSIMNATKEMVAITLMLDGYSFPAADEIQKILDDPNAFAAVAAATPAASSAAAAAPAKVEEPEEESDDDMGFGLFD